MGINTAHPQRVCEVGTSTAGVGPRTQSLSRPGKGAGDSPIEGDSWGAPRRTICTEACSTDGRRETLSPEQQRSHAHSGGEGSGWHFPETAGSWTSRMCGTARDEGGHPLRRRYKPCGPGQVSGRGERGVGSTRLHRTIKVRKPGPRIPRGGEESQRQSGLQRPSPLHPSSPRELASHGHSLGSLRASEGQRGCWERRNSTCSPAAGGPQEQPATPLVHTCASLAAKGLPHYLKTASKQKIIWTSWVTGIAHGGSGRP